VFILDSFTPCALGKMKNKGRMSCQALVEIMPYTERSTHIHAQSFYGLYGLCSGSCSYRVSMSFSASPHEKLQPHTHTAHTGSLRVSYVKAMNLPLLYLHVPSQVAVAIGNVNHAHRDGIKEKRKIWEISG